MEAEDIVQEWSSSDSELCFDATVAGPKIGASVPLEDWTCEWSEQLAVLWHTLCDTTQAYGWPFFDKITFPAFCELAYDHSTRARNV